MSDTPTVRELAVTAVASRMAILAGFIDADEEVTVMGVGTPPIVVGRHQVVYRPRTMPVWQCFEMEAAQAVDALQEAGLLKEDADAPIRD